VSREHACRAEQAAIATHDNDEIANLTDHFARADAHIVFQPGVHQLFDVVGDDDIEITPAQKHDETMQGLNDAAAIAADDADIAEGFHQKSPPGKLLRPGCGRAGSIRGKGYFATPRI